MKIFALSLFLGIAFLQAQPRIAYRGILNAASQMPAGLPGGSIAQGAIFSIAGTRLGPSDMPIPATPPQTSLGGVSVTITQGSTIVNALPLTVSPVQITAIMPAGAPLGAASVQVTFNNARSNPMTVQITAAQFGIYTTAGFGNGPAVLTTVADDGTQTPVTLQTPAQPGQTVILSGTGLASAKPTAFVGGFQAAVLATSTSLGIDQLTFAIPNNAPPGCWTPLYIKHGTSVSNFATMAISADGSPCAEPDNVLASALINGGNIGLYAAARINTRHDFQVPTPRDSTVDMFGAYQAAEQQGSNNFNPMFSLPPVGSCTVYTFPGDLASDDAAIIPGMTPPTIGGLMAGAVALSSASKGPAIAVDSKVYPGMGGVQLAAAVPSLPLTNTSFLDPGALNLSIAGGNDIGAASLDDSAPLPFSWTNRDQIAGIDRSKPLAFAFTGGSAVADVVIAGEGVDLPTNSSTIFLCIGAPGSSAFTVPADVLANLAATRFRTVQSRSFLYVGQWNLAGANPVGAAGLDFSAFLPAFTTGKTIRIQ